jgi:hypothetical protein
VTTTPDDDADHDSTGSSNLSSAPRRAASERCADTVASGRTNPATSSYTPTSSSAGVRFGKRRRTSAASNTSCGRSCSRAAARLPATVRLVDSPR